ncbi:EPIDERMAL PATTERNING FACTOR-like protein 5 [Pyrus ussuriensis x Pyrus communis]|uniref:Epidermal patterning factor-like protein n=1 Tax=Pyrus ussuriensis x Pyrus communis TaxID=2448454 RepID=A0A5N5FMV9_9ROSA|nr:EPIDERMAL PATTERNING FACTOR-like protein 3 [Pyrus x bretschneideri]KAB2604227.1 EPIDERMAL PATTERNING FACTOR-like protein 5 [Pyrus ussuriensis x Pyrus communis]
MKRKTCCITVVVTLLCWVSVTSRPFASYDVPHQEANQTERNQYSPGATFDSKQEVEEGMEQRKYRGLSRLGSRPPICKHLCGSCEPCVPVQTRTTTDHFGVQYANYEPEGWRCKCGSTFFTP